ncbi:hypothetical protein RIF29_21175 [Crotalaria pallida]|uniref:Uncharacterized protein n=1 Tax=Crotalaria pallida TaxID=3830 RepID=A0AAN9F420_CROPI
MSTDLHLHLQLPKLRVETDKPPSDHHNNNLIPEEDCSSPVTTTRAYKVDDESDIVDQAITIIIDDDQTDQQQTGQATTITDDESFKTPTSKENKIPENLTCPPAPRKPKPLVACKRKLMDQFQFFEDTNKEDMDAFFRSTFPKRTCPCK